MDTGPYRVLDVRATGGPEDSGVDEVVEGRLQQAERRPLIGVRASGVIGDREGGVEEARLGAGELEIGLADRSKALSGARRCVGPRADLAHAVGHTPREVSDRLVADRREEAIAVRKMPVGGVGDDADIARHLAQQDRLRTSRSGELDTGLDERGPDGASGPRSPAPRRTA